MRNDWKRPMKIRNAKKNCLWIGLVFYSLDKIFTKISLTIARFVFGVRKKGFLKKEKGNPKGRPTKRLEKEKKKQKRPFMTKITQGPNEFWHHDGFCKTRTWNSCFQFHCLWLLFLLIERLLIHLISFSTHSGPVPCSAE